MSNECKINVLGTEYTVRKVNVEDDDNLGSDCAGYCDTTSKSIVVSLKSKDNAMDNYDVWLNKLIRHEVIHAFLFESGLAENWYHSSVGQDETFVDWIAFQFPKILKVFKQLDCI